MICYVLVYLICVWLHGYDIYCLNKNRCMTVSATVIAKTGFLRKCNPECLWHLKTYLHFIHSIEIQEFFLVAVTEVIDAYQCTFQQCSVVLAQIQHSLARVPHLASHPLQRLTDASAATYIMEAPAATSQQCGRKVAQYV